MATTIKLKNSVTTTNAPSSLAQGEVAINVTDKKVWVGNAATTPVQLLGTGSDGSFTNLTVSGTTALNGGATLGDASGDALTINSSAVSIPNGLNFDSNTFVIDATNNRVGLGSTAPSYKLVVVGSSNSTVAAFNDASAGEAARNLLFTSSSNGLVWTLNSQGSSSLGQLAFATNDTERMRITSTGNLLVGRTSSSGAAYSAEFSNSAADNRLGLWSSGSLLGTIQVNTNEFRVTALGASTNLTFQTNSNIRATIDTSGNLGLGVTPSAWSGYTAAQIINSSFYGKSDNTVAGVGLNYYNNGTNDIYRVTYNASKYEQAGGQHRWFNAPSGTAGNAITFTQAMTLDASGNLGIATTSPSTYGKFVVNGSANADAAIFIGNSSLTGSAPTYKGTVRIIDNPTSTTGHNGGLEFLTSTFGSGYGWKIAAIDSSGVPLTFATRQNSASWTEAMRIDLSGNLLLTTTTSFGKLAVSGIAGTENTCISLREWGNGRGSAMNITAHNTANADVIYFNTSTTNVGKIAITSSSTSYVTSSDYRLKENIAPMIGALDKVSALKPCTYTWKSTGEESQGFIAHELQEVCPDAVVGEKDAVDAEGNPQYQGIDTSFLVATLTAAIQEQQAIITDLKARIETLESK